MHLTRGQIYDSINALSSLAKEKLPRQIAYNLSKTVKVALEDAQALEKERLDLIEKYGPGQVQPENLADFLREWSETRAVTAELWMIPIPFEQLPDSMSAADLGALDWLIEFPSEQAATQPGVQL